MPRGARHCTTRSQVRCAQPGVLFMPLRLGTAIAGNHADTAKWILEQDLALLDHRDAAGCSVLHTAAMFGAKVLLLCACDKCHLTSAHWQDCAKLLCSLGMDVDAKDADGRTPLMLACCVGSLPVASLLFIGGASTTITGMSSCARVCVRHCVCLTGAHDKTNWGAQPATTRHRGPTWPSLRCSSPTRHCATPTARLFCRWRA